MFYIGLGEKFAGDKVTAYPPGSVIVLPGDTWRFRQVNAIGPLCLEYQNLNDDPRRQGRPRPAQSTS